MTKIILTDLDEVIFAWQAPFEAWITKQGKYKPEKPLNQFWDIERWLNIPYEEARVLIDEFNHSDTFGDLKPLPDVVENVLLLEDAGYKFVAITACDTDEWTHQARWHNLRRCFGHAFDTLHCVGLGASKIEFLSRYAPSYWVEDKARHAVDGADLGHTSFLRDYAWNRYCDDKRIIRVQNWHDIANTILTQNKKVA